MKFWLRWKTRGEYTYIVTNGSRVKVNVKNIRWILESYQASTSKISASLRIVLKGTHPFVNIEEVKTEITDWKRKPRYFR